MMVKPLANAGAILAVLDFIEHNLGAYDTKQRQIDALSELITREDVKVGSDGYQTYQPTATALYGKLKSAMALSDRRHSIYATLSNEEMVTTLFTTGRAVLAPEYIRRLKESAMPLKSTPQGDLARSDIEAEIDNQIDDEDIIDGVDPSSKSEEDARARVDVRTVALEESLGDLHKAIERTARIVFPGDTASAPAQLVSRPSQGLQDLYSMVLASHKTDWKSAAEELQSQDRLPAALLFQCLIWAFVRTFVLDRACSLTALSRLLNVNQPPGSYFHEVMSTHDKISVNRVRLAMLNAQYSDRNFILNVLNPAVEVLVSDLILTLAGHVDLIDCPALPDDCWDDMSRRLFAICSDAFKLRGILDLDSNAWKNLAWRHGKIVSGPGFKVDPRFADGISVAFTIMPGLRTKDRDTGTFKTVSAGLIATMNQ